MPPDHVSVLAKKGDLSKFVLQAKFVLKSKLSGALAVAPSG
jgi:hypothetical protein